MAYGLKACSCHPLTQTATCVTRTRIYMLYLFYNVFTGYLSDIASILNFFSHKALHDMAPSYFLHTYYYIFINVFIMFRGHCLHMATGFFVLMHPNFGTHVLQVCTFVIHWTFIFKLLFIWNCYVIFILFYFQRLGIGLFR